MENVSMMRQKNKRGFSLMELLAVMAIMGILSTLAVTGYFSAVRGMTRRRAVSNLIAALNQARQRASIDGTRTALICYNVKHVATPNLSDLRTFSPSYVICKALGRVTCNNPSSVLGGNPLFGDEFTPLDKVFGAVSSDYSFGSRRLYNLSDKEWSEVGDTVTLGAYNANLKSSLTGENLPTTEMLWCFTKKGGGNASWKVGDLYGIEVSPPEVLPKNIYFQTLGAGTGQITVLFDSDGCPKNQNGSPTTVSISFFDKTTEMLFATITVQTDGSVTGGKDIILK